MEKLLIVDDNEGLRQQLKWGFAQEYEILLAGDAREGIALFKRFEPKVVILDLGMPPHEDTSEEGFRCLGEILEMAPAAKVIVMTGNNERDNALRRSRWVPMTFMPNRRF